MILVVLLVPAVSFSRAMLDSSQLSASARAAEWMRDNHMGGILNSVEHWWYTSHPPKVGGEPDRAIAVDPPPSADQPAATTSTLAPHLAQPAAVPVPAGVDPQPGEGVWQQLGPSLGGAPAMYTTQVRPDSVHTSILDGLVWMDPKQVSFQVHPGTKEPGGSWDVPAQVPVEQRLGLLAAFNGGFRLQDARGGFFLDGKTRKDLRDGAASFVVYKDGTATVGAWNRDVSMTPDVVAVRQNLDLIVDNGGAPTDLQGAPGAAHVAGQPVDGLNDNTNGAWGSTLGNKVLVWRSAVCVTQSGAIVYGYGNGLGVLSLATLLTSAGCVRAMELDINPEWTSFNSYGPSVAGDPNSVKGAKVLPEQQPSPNRYLTSDVRDFVAVMARSN